MINPFKNDKFARFEGDRNSMIVPIRFEKKEEIINEINLPQSDYDQLRLSPYNKILLTQFSRAPCHDLDMLFFTVLKYSEPKLVIFEMIDVLKA